MAPILRASYPRRKTVNETRSDAGTRSRFSTAAFRAPSGWSSGSLISVSRNICSMHEFAGFQERDVRIVVHRAVQVPGVAREEHRRVIVIVRDGDTIRIQKLLEL